MSKSVCPAVKSTLDAPPALEVANVIRTHGKAFLAQYGRSLSLAQRRAFSALAHCRTAALGGHVDECDKCGARVISYNSCRNRHCPKCQAGRSAAWLERETKSLLPVDYYHVVFTLPHELGPQLFPVGERHVPHEVVEGVVDRQRLLLGLGQAVKLVQDRTTTVTHGGGSGKEPGVQVLARMLGIPQPSTEQHRGRGRPPNQQDITTARRPIAASGLASVSGMIFTSLGGK